MALPPAPQRRQRRLYGANIENKTRSSTLITNVEGTTRVKEKLIPWILKRVRDHSKIISAGQFFSRGGRRGRSSLAIVKNMPDINWCSRCREAKCPWGEGEGEGNTEKLQRMLTRDSRITKKVLYNNDSRSSLWNFSTTWNHTGERCALLA